jgi:hypothetical protein
MTDVGADRAAPDRRGAADGTVLIPSAGGSLSSR